MTLLVLLNQGSGRVLREGGALVETIRNRFAERAIAAEVCLTEADAMADAVRAGIDRYDAIVVGGGDGSVNAAANVLAGSDTPLGVLPLGSLNHFARDVGVPTDLDTAIDVIVGGMVRRVDVVEVNSRIFVNNSSVGLYPAIVADRDRHMRRRGRTKWLATAIAGWQALHHARRRLLTIHAQGRVAWRRTLLLVVGNNQYELHFPNIGARPHLDGGQLCLYIVRGNSRWALLRLAWRALTGNIDADREFERLGGLSEVDIACAESRLAVALDGEVVVLATPLHYQIRPAALAVYAPPAQRS